MKTKLCIICCTLVLLLLQGGMATDARALTADSQPVFSKSVLHIPRIDVEGYGPLDVQLRLVDPATLEFQLAKVSAAPESRSPGATYDLQTRTVNVPRLLMNGAYYEVRMERGANNRFLVSSYLPVNPEAQGDYLTMCAGCHGVDGLGGTVAVPLRDCSWCGSAGQLATYIAGNMPLGAPAQCGAQCADALASYILAVFNTPSGSGGSGSFDALRLLSPQATLRKASLQLLSRLPTDDESSRVETGGETALREVLDAMMTEPAFYRRLMEIFNERLLTNRYLSSNGKESALNLIRQYPNARWFDPGEEQRDEEYEIVRKLTNDSVATEPLQLINHVVRNELPATEILTADYMMVNGYSAKSYGITSVNFNDAWDPEEYRPARLQGIPHAGILTSSMFLNRFPTTRTNRNRARARVVYDLFLDVDILALDGVRPDGSAVDLANAAPTMENPDCVKCHSLLDPVASAFQNWDYKGRFERPKHWYDDMFSSGFGGAELPASEQDSQLQWLARQLAADPRFDSAMVRILYAGLTGDEPLSPPGVSATVMERQAYTDEAAMLNEVKSAYVADNRKLKTLIRELLLSPSFRAEELSDTAYAQMHQQTGSTVLLPPERLHRKIDALLGFEWRGPLDHYHKNKDNDWSARLLNGHHYYHQLYGGIDSFNITEPLREPNGLMARVQERMANELACYAVPSEFLLPASERKLLPYVEQHTTPISSASRQAIRRNIQHLHEYLLGETLAESDPEIEATYELFVSAMEAGQAALTGGETHYLPSACKRYRDIDSGEELGEGALNSDPVYVIRSWMAVVAYLLTDFNFVYE